MFQCQEMWDELHPSQSLHLYLFRVANPQANVYSKELTEYIQIIWQKYSEHISYFMQNDLNTENPVPSNIVQEWETSSLHLWKDTCSVTRSKHLHIYKRPTRQSRAWNVRGEDISLHFWCYLRSTCIHAPYFFPASRHFQGEKKNQHMMKQQLKRYWVCGHSEGGGHWIQLMMMNYFSRQKAETPRADQLQHVFQGHPNGQSGSPGLRARHCELKRHLTLFQDTI